MASVATISRRLRRYIGDSPYGVSVSGYGAAESLTPGSENKIMISVAGGVAQEVSLGPTAYLVNAHSIAQKLQDGVRALDPADVMFTNFTAQYVAGQYVLKAGAPSSEGHIVVTNAATDNAADDLKLGVQNGGAEYVDPVARYTDAELEYFINEGLASYNELSESSFLVDQLNNHEALLVLHYAWMNALEAIAGESVYTYRETIGRDTLDLSQIFKNIMELLKYLRGRIKELQEESGVGSVFVTELTRNDYLYNERLPTYVKSSIVRPGILNLSRTDATSLLIEWDEIHHEDLEAVQVYTQTTTGNMLDLSLITDESSSNKAGIVEAATLQRTIYNGFDTVVAVRSLPSQVINVLVVLRTKRNRYLYSDQYSIDLANASAVAVKEYVNL